MPPCPFSVVIILIYVILAGCDIIETNSYQASVAGFMKHLNLSKEDSYNLIKKSVFLAKTAIERAQKEGILQGKDLWF